MSVEKTKKLVKDFREGKFRLGKEFTTACISLFRELSKDKFEKEEHIEELMSRPVDPLTHNFLEAVSNAKTPAEVKHAIDSMDTYIKNMREAVVPHGKKLLEGKKTVMVLDYSKTIVEMLKGLDTTIYVPETTPEGSGRWMVKKLENAILIPDSAVGYFMPSVDLILTRSCCISTSNLLGATIIKPAAILAKHHGKPLYVVAELLRFGENFVVTEYKWDTGGPNRSPLYDQIEHGMVQGIITEEGILTPSEYVSKATQKKAEMIK